MNARTSFYVLILHNLKKMLILSKYCQEFMSYDIFCSTAEAKVQLLACRSALFFFFIAQALGFVLIVLHLSALNVGQFIHSKPHECTEIKFFVLWTSSALILACILFFKNILKFIILKFKNLPLTYIYKR